MPLTEESGWGRSREPGKKSGKGPAQVRCLRVQGREDTEVMESVKAPGTLS